jgi:hypothetical protein
MRFKNRRLIGWLLSLSLALPFAVATVVSFRKDTTVRAQTSQPSAKVTAKTSQNTLIPETTGTGGWVTILSNYIKTAEQKDLFVTAALETGLYTQTTVIGGTSEAHARLQVRVLVDGGEIEPGPITYGERRQTLTALLTTPEMIELILKTMAAASFSWVGIDIPEGVHNVTVQARVETDNFGTAVATGMVGKGTMTVESVRLIRGEDVTDPPVVP